MDSDVVVIGAGAAGIAAGRRLVQRARRVLVVEAMDRVGGRAHTMLCDGMPIDLGCGWLHSAERNPLVAQAETEGFAVDRAEAAWGKQYRNLGFSAEEQRRAHEAVATFEQEIRQSPADDVAGNALARDHPWRGYIDMMSGALNGAETDLVSATDLIAYEDHASDNNWRVPEGYGALFASLAGMLPIRLGTRVTAVDHAGPGVTVETCAGSIRAGAVIVTVPTNILARGDIAFSPALDAHRHAASCLPLGRVEKVFLSIADREAVPPETHLLGDPHTARTGSYYLRPFGRPVVECFFGGIAARTIAEAGAAECADFAIRELGRLLGSDFARGLRLLAASGWHAEQTIGGAYSHALPGEAQQRVALARPASERLFFAGEACSAHDFSTAHGAWSTGLAAADDVERMLSRGKI